MPLSTDVLIVGGGIVGAACARAVATLGARVTILRHPAPQFEGWRAAAGMLAAQVEAGPEDPIFELALAGRGFYRRHAEALRSTTGIDIGLEEGGILQVAQTEPNAAAGKAKVAWQRQRAYRADWLDREEIGDLYPGIDGGLGGFWAAEDGQVHPQRTHQALMADAQLRGAKVVDEVVTGLDHNGAVLQGVTSVSGSYRAAHVVIANGAWAGQLANLPRPISVAPVYGRMLVYPWPAAFTPAIIYGDHCYLVHREGELLAGATMEHPGFIPSDDPTAMARLLSHLTALYPALADAVPYRTIAGFRPGTPDGLPIIGPEPRLPGLWYATGHGRNGILMAGTTGELIAQGIAGEEWGEALAIAAPQRFWTWAEG